MATSIGIFTYLKVFALTLLHKLHTSDGVRLSFARKRVVQTRLEQWPIAIALRGSGARWPGRLH